MTSRPGLLFEANFNSGSDLNSMGFLQEGNQTGRVVDFAGERAVRLDLNHYSDAVSIRTELQPNQLPEPYFTNGMHAKYGQTYWYGIKSFLPSGWEKDSTAETVMQWHDWPDPGEAWKNPAIALMIDNRADGPHYVVQIRADSKAYTPSSGDRYDSFKVYDLGKIDGSVGQWTEWVWKIKWGYDNSGSLVLYKNGEEVLNLPNQANCFNDQKGPYFKFGTYKWDWESGQDTGADSRTKYYDDLRIAAGPDAGYDTVAPTQKSAPAPAPVVQAPTDLEPVPAPTPAPTPEPAPAPTGPTLGVGKTQAESLNLSGGYYRDNWAGSDGGVIRVKGSGEANGTFDGPAGTYALTVGFINEDDGAASFAVKVNGRTVNSWTGTGGTGGVETKSVTLDLKAGDKITLVGAQEMYEYARFDWVRIDKAGTTAPAPAPTPAPAPAPEPDVVPLPVYDQSIPSTSSLPGATVSRTSSYTLSSSQDNLVLTGTGAANGFGNSGANVLVGNDAANVLNGNSGNDRLYGGNGNDQLYGGGGNDRLYGGAGNDTLMGNDGKDILAGGSGADRFIFAHQSQTGVGETARDEIMDFRGSEGDRIDLTMIDARSDATGNQGFSYIGSKAFTGTAGELRAAKLDGVMMIEGDINGDGRPDMQIELHGVTDVQSSYFLL